MNHKKTGINKSNFGMRISECGFKIFYSAIRNPQSAIYLCVLVLGCSGETGLEALRQAMYDQPKYEPFEASAFFRDGRSARPRVVGTVARGQLRIDEHFYTGRVGQELVTTFPFPVTREVLARGQERYDIFCTPCHDRAGAGQGMVVKRGFRAPPSLHIDRLRAESVGHFFDVITNGNGAMYSYASRIAPEDRWAIVAYIRALQLSQHAGLEDVPAEVRRQLEGE